jgi:oligogalacturonide lyase
MDNHLPSRRSFLGGLTVPMAAGVVASEMDGPLYAADQGPQAASVGGVKKAPGKVQKVDSEVREYKDSDTGARVRQLTGDGSDNVHLYFTAESFADGSDRVIFGSNRSGRFQFYLLEIGDRRLVQLTDGEKVEPQQACLSKGRLFYFDGPTLRCLELGSMEDRALYGVPKGWEPHLTSCTADGAYVAFAYGEDQTVSTETGRIYSTMAESFYQRPACVIMRIEAANGRAVAAWGERAWISHVIIHPKQPNLILFCHEGGSYSLQRMWTVDISHERGRQAQPLYPQKPNEYCVHEYFTREGEVGFQYEIEREGRVESYNAFVRPDGSWLRQYLLPGPRPWHIQSNTSNTLIVGDAGYLSPQDKDGLKYISLITHPNGHADVRRLCRYQVGGTQHSHGHPVFSLDDRWVLFNSRIGERDNIFMADVQSL